MRAVVDAFLPALPAEVREVIEHAERGLGPAVVWLRGMAPLPLSECLKMLNEPRIPSIVVGWLVGMTLFGGDPKQQLAAALGRRSFRDDVIPHVLRAFTAGVVSARGLMMANARLWTSIEMLVGRVRHEDAAPICDALPVALVSTYAVVRGCALRIAHELGAPARSAIAVAHERAEAAGASSSAHALGDALVALAGGEPSPPNTDDAQQLERLLAGWRTTHDLELERAIARVGGDLARARGPILARSTTELEGAWHAVAAKRDPIDLSRLLELRFPSHWKRAQERVARLAELPADPRIAIRLAEVARGYGSRSSRPLHVAIGRIIADAPTPSALPGLDAVATVHAAAYGRAREAITALAIQPADPALLALARAGERPDVDALYAQHAANPGDLEARAVLADALQAAGDPRGELITLQLAIADGTASAGAARRVASLLATHGDSWTGPLPGIDCGARRFERGFLVACETTAENAAIARTLDRPEWRTVEELSLHAYDIELVPLLARLPLLRRLCAHDVSFEALARVARAPIPQLQVLFTRGRWIPPPELFPELRVLGGSWFAETWNAAAYHHQLRAAGERGTHAIVHTAFQRAHLAEALALARSGPPEVRFTLARHRSGFDPLGWRLRVRRDAGPMVDVAWTYHRWADNIVAELFEPLAAAGVVCIALHVPEMLKVHLDRLVVERPHGVAVVPGAPIDLLEPV